MIVDSHCHLDFDELSPNIEDVLLRAKAADVKILQTICTKISQFPKVQKIAEEHENIYCSVGVHPHEVKDEGVFSTEDIVNYTKHKKVIGIGETGLDYYYEYSDKDLQRASFINHIRAAQETQLPIIIHTRSADEDTIKILKEEMHRKKFPGLIHCFTATQELADECLNLGMYISISGIITFKNAEDLRKVVKNLPLDRLLVETDAPYLAPMPMRGKVNEPSFVKYTVDYLAGLLEKTSEEISAQTTENFFRLFTKVERT